MTSLPSSHSSSSSSSIIIVALGDIRFSRGCAKSLGDHHASVMPTKPLRDP